MKLLITSWVVIIALTGSLYMFRLASVHGWSMLRTTGLAVAWSMLYVLARYALSG